MSNLPSPDSVLPATTVSGRRGMRYPIIFWSLVAFSLVAVVLGAWLLVQAREATESGSGAPRSAEQMQEPAIDFQLATLDGGTLRLSDLRGQVVLLNFWATWCPPCQAEMPDFEALYRANKDKHDFVVVAVDVEESPETARAFADRLGLTFTVLPDSEGKVSNFRYFIRSLPASYIIDRSGNVRYRWIGQQGRAAVEDMLERVW